ncbi:MAG TPA: penicillin-binding transpeptidase domain-containing protein, partial [Bdellovibrionota bacterium]|nr:penicillin-binding transpeptidase domain-containing protein [Bdellovibrionota bacterium]
MSWRDYQERRRRGSRKISGLHVGTLVLLLGLVGWILLRPKSEPVVVSDTPAPKADSGDLNRGSVGHLIETADLSEGPGEIHVMYGNAALVADLTFDEGLQRFILKELRRRKVDWAGVAVVDALTGEVLALASHSEREPSARNLALRATFSAASVFKVVTAAAAVEDRGYRRSTLVRYEGNSTKVRSREILHDRGRESMTLAEGFAKSANAIFGKIGARAVGGGLLSEYAERFGFNTPIPFIPAVELSRAEIPREDPMEEARAAAGFGEVTLSPLHGALIAGAVVADGFMMEPFLVRRIVASTGRLRYAT